MAVISEPGFTGLFLAVFSKIFLSCRLSQLFKPAFTGKKSLFIKGFSRTIPTEYFPEQVPSDNGHGFVPRHLGFIFFLVVELSIETASLNQRQGDCLQDFSKQLPALFADLVLTLECAALPGFEIEAGVTHQLTPVVKIRERAGFSKQSGKIFSRDYVWSRRRDQRIVLSQLIHNRNHLFRDVFFSLQCPKIIVQPVIEIFLKYLHIPGGHIVQGGTLGIFPQTLQGAGHNARCRFFHFSAEEIISVLDNSVRVAAILFDQGQSGITIEEILFEGIITEEFNQQFADPAAMAGNGDIAFVVDFVKFSEHQIFLANHPEFDDFIQFSQGANDPWVFLVGFIVVVALHDAEFGNRLSIDVVGEKTEPPGRFHEFILVLASRFTDHPQAFSAMIDGNFIIGEQPLLDNGCAVPAGIRKLFASDFKEKTQGVFVNIHGDVDNIIEVDFLGSLRNLHNGFSFCVDSTGYEIQPSYCTSALEGEAFLLAA